MLTTSDFSYFEVTTEEIYGGYAYQITRNLLTLPKLFETKLTGLANHVPACVGFYSIRSDRRFCDLQGISMSQEKYLN